MAHLLTSTGVFFDLLNPTPDMIHEKDIARALSNICRFNGHTKRHYSVAQHSILVSQVLPLPLKLKGLLHDAPEAYIGDMVTPLKNHMPDFKAVEERIWHAVCQKFGLTPEMEPEIKEADLILLATEKRDLLPVHPAPWPALENIRALDEVIVPMESMADAEQAFLFMFRTLMSMKA